MNGPLDIVYFCTIEKEGTPNIYSGNVVCSLELKQESHLYAESD